MNGTTHAAVLAAIVVATIMLRLLGDETERRSIGRLVFAVLTLFLIFFVGVVLNVHGCGSGNPLMQWIIPAASTSYLLLSVKQSWTRSALTAIVGIAISAWLSASFVDLVHTSHYTGSPEYARTSAAILEREVEVEFRWHTWLTGLYEVRGRP
ncbi:MAG: hypothetical protein AAF517_08575 [Planctomycetota bacterium]